MLLSFDRIIVSDTRWSNFDAILSEVLPVKGDNVRRVDGEGTAVGKSSVKPDVIKVGCGDRNRAPGSGRSRVDPVGAAVGAGVGAAFGVGAVVIQRGKNIKAEPQPTVQDQVVVRNADSLELFKSSVLKRGPFPVGNAARF